ncbi:MAG: hypothetical protein AB7P04_05490 [Bacteriovoracia bacterium]
MRASTSTSKAIFARGAWGWPLCLLVLAVSSAYADDLDPVPNPQGNPQEVEDYSETPYTQYGETNEDEDEAEAANFFQHGRFFGVSLGVGFEGATGNRGILWAGGFPMVSIRIHYWFDFNFAMQMEYSTVSHFFDASGGGSITDVNVNHIGLDLKYYFDTRNLSSALTFSNPYVVAGAGNYSKGEVDQATQSVSQMNAFGFSAGFGFDFLISRKKSYFELEAKLHFVPYEDRGSPLYQTQGIEDLTGAYYTLVGSLLFTW